MSIAISRFEKLFSLQLNRVPIDAVGQTILQRIKDLLSHRPDVSRKQFLDAVGRPTPSWGSEFFNGQRTTNDLRLLMRMARYFGVTVGYLLNESDKGRDADAVTLLDAWGRISDPRARRSVLHSALMLADQTDAHNIEPSHELPVAPGRGGGTTKGSKKRR